MGRKEGVNFKLELYLKADEHLLIKTQHFDDEKIKFKNVSNALIFGFVGLALITICLSIIAISIVFMHIIIEIYILILPLTIGFVFFALSCLLLITKYYEAKTYFIITSARIMRLVELKHSLRIKKQIPLSEISHMFDWGNALVVFPEKTEGSGYYDGTETEEEFSYRFFGLGGIVVRFNDPKGEKAKKKMKRIIIENANLQKHPNLEFLYYKIGSI